MGNEPAGALTAADSTSLASYARWAAATAQARIPEQRERLAYLGLGLAGEAGEVADSIKRLFRDGRCDSAALADELGDVAYYWAALCDAAGHSPEAVLAASRAKIAARVAEAQA